jgi:outer membrane protein, heavy metal efflux system
MQTNSRAGTWWLLIALGGLAVLIPGHALGQAAPVASPAAQAAPAAPQNLPTRITLDDAIDLALKHNHSLQAARTTILQNQAQEITANLRPNPILLGDAQFLPFFEPSNFNNTYLDNGAQFDVGVSYLFERGKKRQRRLQAAKDQTAVTTATVDDNARGLTFNVASQFIAALLAQSELDLAQKDLDSFQKTVDISQASYNAGSMSGADLLKIKIQLLQFQMDVSAAKLARVQALASLRQLLGYESVAANYEVAGDLEYKPVTLGEDDLKAMALKQRPDVRAAQLGITAAQSQLALAKADGKQDVTAQANYTHVSDLSTASIFASIPLPVFNRNQGEIARTGYAVTQSQELSSEQASIALTDVTNSYEGLRTADEVVVLYQSGYLKQAEDSRDISEYAYQHGAASLLDFLDAERSYRATELAYRQSLAGYMTSLEQLRQAVGTRSLP